MRNVLQLGGCLCLLLKLILGKRLVLDTSTLAGDSHLFLKVLRLAPICITFTEIRCQKACLLLFFLLSIMFVEHLLRLVPGLFNRTQGCSCVNWTTLLYSRHIDILKPFVQIQSILCRCTRNTYSRALSKCGWAHLGRFCIPQVLALKGGKSLIKRFS